MVKPALSRGEFQCIGATTLSEYRQHIEKDGALERRFQKVIAEAPTEAETLMILKNVKEKYEEHHSVTYTEEAIEQCVKLTGRYITDRNFPDKALDVLDEAGSRSQLKEIKTPEILTNLEKNLDKTIRDKKIAVSNQDYEEASRLRDVEKRVRLTIEIETRSWEEKLKADKKVVSAEKVAEVISMMTGVPLSKLTENENAKLARMSDDLKGKVIGQSEAVDKITKAILRNRIGLKDPNRPIGSFVFSGPTGTGKTFLAKMVAKHVFGDENAMIRVDMSEYMEKFNATKLIGAPPGYVGHEEGGQLTEKVRRKPYCVVLFDEIEKAHPDIFNTLLQILDEGHITDGLGRKINFKNTLIIMTTNTGQKKASEFSRGVGFGSSSDTKISGASKDIVSKEIHKMFSPEFLNRIDEIVEFNKLSKENIMEIVDLEIKSIVPRFKDLGYKITIGKSLREKMGESGYDEKYGARPLRRLIQKWIEDPIAERIVLGEIKENDKIVLSLNPKAKEEEIPVRVKVEKTKEEEDK
jgi:ATP-dependent Clp protease ATP-binding subunit ClpC